MLFQVRNSRDDAKGISNISRSKGRNEYVICIAKHVILFLHTFRECKIFYSIINEKPTLLPVKNISKIILNIEI